MTRSADPLRQSLVALAGAHLVHARAAAEQMNWKTFNDHLLIIMEICWLNGAITIDILNDPDYQFIVTNPDVNILTDEQKAYVERKVHMKLRMEGGVTN